MSGTNGTTGIELTTSTGIDGHDGRQGPHQPVGNNFFFGQLLTPRAMTLEQRLHTNRVRNLAQFVAGKGIVCGLDVSADVREGTVRDEGGTGETADFLHVEVSPGLALDCCGRQLVLEETATERRRTDSAEVDGAQHLAVYLRYEKCGFEPVPVVGVENACDERCVDSRFVERGVVEYEFERPEDEAAYKPVSTVDFPSEAEVGNPPRPLSDAPSGTFLVERWPGGDVEAADPEGVVIAVVGAGDERLYNAETDEVTLDPDDVLVDADRNWFVVSDADARTLPARAVDAIPEQQLVAFGPTPVVIRDADPATGEPDAVVVTGRTTFGTGSVTVRVDSPPGSETAFSHETIVQVEDQAFVATFPDGGASISSGTNVVVSAAVSVEGSEAEAQAVEDVVAVAEGADETEPAFGEVESALARIARSYYENRPLAECETCGDDERVLLGWFTRDASWETTSFARGPQVYGNDLLHAAVVRHGTDFRNPHEVALSVSRPEESVSREEPLESGKTYYLNQELSLSGLNAGASYEVRRLVEGEIQADAAVTVEADAGGNASVTTGDPESGTADDLGGGSYVVVHDGDLQVVVDGIPRDAADSEVTAARFVVVEQAYAAGAVLTVADLPTSDEDVHLESPDRTVSITPGFGGRSIQFEVAGLDTLRRRVETHEAHALRKAVENTHIAYSVVAEKFADDATVTGVTGQIASLLPYAADADVPGRVDPTEFEQYSESVYDQETQLRDHLDANDVATQTSFERYRDALRRFDSIRTGDDLLAKAHAQESAAEAAEWLTPVPSEEPIPEEPALVCLSMEDIPEGPRRTFPIEVPNRDYVIRQLDPDPDLEPVFTEDEEPEGELKLEIPTSVGGLIIEVPDTTVIEVWLTLNGNSITLIARDDQEDLIEELEVDGDEGIEQRVRIDTDGVTIASLEIEPSFEEEAETQYITEICVSE